MNAKVTELKQDATRILTAAAERRSKVAEKIAGNFHLSSFDLEALIECQALQTVWGQIEGTIDYGINNDFEDDVILAEVKQRVLSNALSTTHINSSSNVSVEMDIRVREVWVKVAGEFVDPYAR